ncbi:MAG: hypothetical protein ACI4JN_06680 [Ruminococcus sp.]
MFEGCYLDFEGCTKAVKGEPAVEMKVNLRADDTRISVDLGTVYTEKRTFKDFLLSEYSTSDGITVKNTILPDGTRVAESYDAVKREYVCSAFDEKGTLISREYTDSSGKYAIEQRLPDGTMHKESGSSIFVRGFDGKVI